MFDPLEEYIQTSTDKNFLITLKDKFIPIDKENAEKEEDPVQKERKLKGLDILSEAVNKRLNELG